jgi:outer membrane receptor protein involved in Fe transport
MIRKIYLTIILSVICGMAVMAQSSGSIQGKVVDKATGEALPFASVVAELNGNQVGGAQTDIDGKFTIKPLTPGKYNIKATFVGYGAAQVEGIIVSSDKITFQDIKLTSGAVNINEVVITEYTIPLIDKGNVTTQKTITAEDIVAAPTRDVKTLAATTAGVTQRDEGEDLNVRGSRSNATDYYVDGVKVRGAVNLPQSSLEQITVVTGGVPAQYGDNTGGLINITTKGPSKEFSGGVEFVTSELFDKYGYNLASANLSGPLWSQKDENGKKTRTVAGFFLAGEYQYEKDPDPSSIDLYKVKDDKYTEITEHPLTLDSTGSGYVLSSSYIRNADLEKIKAKQNTQAKTYRLDAKVTVSPVEKVDLTFGGNYSHGDNNPFNWNFALFNTVNNGNSITTDWNAFGRITQRFGSGSSDKDKEASVIKNAYYTLQFDVSKHENTTQSAVHEDRLFDYGYVGKFTQTLVPAVQLVSDTMYNPNTGEMIQYEQVGFAPTNLQYEPGNVNPLLQNYTQTYYNAYDNISSQFDPRLSTTYFLINGTKPPLTYGIWSTAGRPADRYTLADQMQYRATISGSADIKNHAVVVGFEFEQLIDRGYGIAPMGLWGTMKSYANQYNSNVDTSVSVYDGNIVYHPRFYSNAGGSSGFFENIRTKLGLSNTDYVDIDSYDRSTYSLDLFTPDELQNGGVGLTYHGYDYTGKKTSGTPTFKDYFSKKDENGNYTREIDAFRPVYMAGYIQDNFAINDLIFNVGVRVDRFDANQKVLIDPFVLYPTYKAGELDIPNKPSNIGNDFVVYVNNLTEPSVNGVVGYRDGSTWYNAKGEVIADPKVLAAAAGGKIAPYLRDVTLATNGTSKEAFNADESFKDYDPQVTVMPRVAFSFPISDEALFYAHYDLLTQRPSDGYRNDPSSYLLLATNQAGTINNPDLKPERTTEYEIGFSQKLSSSSVMSISAYYHELRNQIQIVNMFYAFPTDYTTYGNVDFGTVKGMSFSYDLRRTGNIRMTFAYTLQFADGTGSSATSSANLASNGQPYLRAIFPFNYDQRHNLTASIDYRYGSGKDYNGPTWFDKQFFQNTGINFQFNVSSGTPYSRQYDVQSLDLSAQNVGVGKLEGSINGSRLPWQSRIDVKVDRNIELKVGKGEEKKKTMFLNIYFQVTNLLDANNIMSVYSYTGSPSDDGFLTSPLGIQTVNSQVDPQSFTEQYELKANNPDNYSLPRRMRLGVRLDF